MQKLLQPPLLSINICSVHNVKGEVIQIRISKMLSLSTRKIICATRTHNFTHFISQYICTPLGTGANLSTNIRQAVYFCAWNNKIGPLGPILFNKNASNYFHDFLQIMRTSNCIIFAICNFRLYQKRNSPGKNIFA